MFEIDNLSTFIAKTKKVIALSNQQNKSFVGYKKK